MGGSEYTGRSRRSRRVDEAEPSETLIGVNPVLEQLRREPRRISRVRVADGAERAVAAVISLARESGVPVVIEGRRQLDRRAGRVAHQGVLAEVAPYGYVEIEDLVAVRPGCLLVADQVTDPRNLGALVRSAEAAGVGGVVVPRDRSAGVTAAVAKASAGATALIPVARVTNLARALRQLKDGGYWVVGLDATAPESLFSFSFPDFCAIVVGSEGRGLRALTRELCDHLVSIPMMGKVGSLNVSVAGALACFERLRQRHRIDSSSRR